MLNRFEQFVGSLLFPPPAANPEPSVSLIPYYPADEQAVMTLTAGENNASYIAGNEVAGGKGTLQALVNQLQGTELGHGEQMKLYRTIRRALPVLNAAINKRRFLEGVTVFEAKDQGLQTAIREWAESVPFGYYEDTELQTGLDAWADAVAENADELGIGFGEIVIGEDGRYIERLVTPRSDTFNFDPVPTVRNDRKQVYYRLTQKQDGRSVPIEGGHIVTLAFFPDPNSPWPRPLVWGCEFVTEVVLRMMLSLNNLWWRSGDPSELYQLIYDKEAVINTPEMKADAQLLASYLARVYQARRRGGTGDIQMAMKGGEIKRTQIGEPNPGLTAYFRDHYTAIAGQVVGVSDVPAFLFPAGTIPADGLNSDRATMETSLSVTSAQKRNVRKHEIIRRAVDTMLITERSAGHVGRYSLYSEIPSIVEQKGIEESRKMREDANAAAIDNALILGEVELNDEQRRYLEEAGVLETNEA